MMCETLNRGLTSATMFKNVNKSTAVLTSIHFCNDVSIITLSHYTANPFFIFGKYSGTN